MAGMDVPLQQSADFARALSVIGRDVSKITLRSGGQAYVINRKVPVIGTISLVSRGPVWPHDVPPDSRVVDLRDLGATIINAETADPAVLRAAGFRQIMTPAHIAWLDITGNDADRRARLLPKWRASLAKRPFRTTLRVFDLIKDNWLFDADTKLQKTRKYRALSHEVTAQFAIIAREETLFAQMHDQAGPIGAMLFLRHGRIATYHIGWTTEAGRKVAAHHHLLMQVADHLATQGVVSLDLGQVNTEDLPGLARFKIGTGAQVRALGGTWLRLPGCRHRLA